jgi:glycogen phosphorylase
MTTSINSFVANTHIAYLTMEIALREDIHTYSGGLGVLAGDTARTCADLRLPVVFVSLISRKGYLRQTIDSSGAQVDHDDPWTPADWATPLGAMVAITLGKRVVWIRPWLYLLTSPLKHEIPVILLDTDVEENSSEDRDIAGALYGDGLEYRLRQDAVLGIGAVRVLQALGFYIHKWHLNEGHAAFSTVELLRRHPRSPGSGNRSEPFYDREPVLRSCVFTTHTPVESAHDKFPYPLVESVLGDFIETNELKRYAGDQTCNMTRLALNLSGYVNGVARRHAELARQMFPGHAVRAITNGVHTATWAHPAFARLYDRRVPHWRHEPEALVSADQWSDDEIWAAHSEAKADLIADVQRRAGVVLDPKLPIIGFSRRMTGYKRPDLLFSDMGRLQRIAERQPFQLLFSGKAHPRDDEGKRLIAEIHRQLMELSGGIRGAFVEDYDLSIAAKLVSGCDIWLNTPLPPLEASGTSGMKAAVNGVLNFSVLDGWWLEGCIEGVTGWAIGGSSSVKDDPATHAAELYEKLEVTVLPLYYGHRDGWLGMMKQTIAKLAAWFNTHRMMRRYAAEAYLH